MTNLGIPSNILRRLYQVSLNPEKRNAATIQQIIQDEIEPRFFHQWIATKSGQHQHQQMPLSHRGKMMSDQKRALINEVINILFSLETVLIVTTHMDLYDLGQRTYQRIIAAHLSKWKDWVRRGVSTLKKVGPKWLNDGVYLFLINKFGSSHIKPYVNIDMMKFAISDVSNMLKTYPVKLSLDRKLTKNDKLAMDPPLYMIFAMCMYCLDEEAIKMIIKQIQDAVEIYVLGTRPAPAKPSVVCEMMAETCMNNMKCDPVVFKAQTTQALEKHKQTTRRRSSSNANKGSKDKDNAASPVFQSLPSIRDAQRGVKARPLSKLSSSNTAT